MHYAMHNAPSPTTFQTMMKPIHALVAALILCLTCTTRAEEEPVKRSSHPQGYISADHQPVMATRNMEPANGTTTHTGSASPAASTAAPQNTSQNRQTSTSGVNLTGSTRIDAKAQAANATAIGQENTSGNRVGSIGGK